MNDLLGNLSSKSALLCRSLIALIGAFAVSTICSALLPLLGGYLFGLCLFVFLVLCAPDGESRFTTRAIVCAVVGALIYQVVSYLCSTLIALYYPGIEWFISFLIYSVCAILWCLFLAACLYIAYGIKEGVFAGDRRPFTVAAFVGAIVFCILAGAADASASALTSEMIETGYYLDLMTEPPILVTVLPLLQKGLLWIASTCLLLTMKVGGEKAVGKN